MNDKPPGTHEFEQASLCWEKAAECRHAARGLFSEGHGKSEKQKEAATWALGGEAWTRAGHVALAQAEEPELVSMVGR